MTRHVRSVALALLATSCSDRPPVPLLQRVAIAAAEERTTIQADVERSRAGVVRVASDLRECWTASVGTSIGLDRAMLGFDPGQPLAFAVAIDGLTPAMTRDGFNVRFELEIEGAGKTSVKTDLPATKAASGWTSLPNGSLARDVDRIVLSCQWIGAVPPSEVTARACFAPVNRKVASSDATHDGPNILVLAVDTLRADHLGCHGYARPTTPHLDRLAQRGVLFEHAFSAAPWTLPSFGSLFTSQYPSRHRAGVLTERELAFGTDAPGPLRKTLEHLRPDVTTLAEVLRARGWRTGGIYCNPYLDPETGLDRGFEDYTRYQYNAEVGTDMAIQWLEARGHERWFLFLHFIDPHYPYAPPDPYAAKFSGRPFGPVAEFVPPLDVLRKPDVDPDLKKLMVDLYDGEIAYTDDHIGRLLAWLEQRGGLDRTIVVLISDHGDEHWEHKSFDHGQSQYDELLHVPLIVSYPPRLPSGKRVAARVRSIDVLPTILELAGIDSPRDIEGVSLLGPELVDRDSISEATLWGKRETKAIQTGAHKLIAAGSKDDLLFDRALDLRELSNRAAADPAMASSLRARLLQHHATAPPPRATAPPVEFAPGTRAHLRNLGYAGDEEVAPASQPK